MGIARLVPCAPFAGRVGMQMVPHCCLAACHSASPPPPPRFLWPAASAPPPLLPAPSGSAMEEDVPDLQAQLRWDRGHATCLSFTAIHIGTFCSHRPLVAAQPTILQPGEGMHNPHANRSLPALNTPSQVTGAALRAGAVRVPRGPARQPVPLLHRPLYRPPAAVPAQRAAPGRGWRGGCKASGASMTHAGVS